MGKCPVCNKIHRNKKTAANCLNGAFNSKIFISIANEHPETVDGYLEATEKLEKMRIFYNKLPFPKKLKRYLEQINGE